MAESLVAIGPKTARCRRRSSSFRKSNSEDRNIRSIPLASLLRLAPAQFVLWPADPGAFVLEATSMSMLGEFFFPKASAMLGFSFRRLREERDRMSGSGGRAVDGLWTGGSCRNSMGGG